MTNANPTCDCGHDLDEHDRSQAGWPCLVAGCSCVDFVEDLEEDEE
jgi:hypothetical protein